MPADIGYRRTITCHCDQSNTTDAKWTRMDVELAEHDMNDVIRGNVKPLQIKETATGRHDEMERVTGIEPA